MYTVKTGGPRSCNNMHMLTGSTDHGTSYVMGLGALKNAVKNDEDGADSSRYTRGNVWL